MTEFRDDPLVIGATGGSGTRVFAKIARDAGFHMGWKVDDQDDAKAFSRFLTHQIPAWIRHDGSLPAQRRREADEEFFTSVRTHLQVLPDPGQAWGAKNPRSMLMLPFWHEQHVSISHPGPVCE